MFANLKKKIEEEVGDLSRLTSPINLAGALGDRRVGGSTQGTNTPNLGSRQSSVASLIDIGPDRPVGQSRPHASNAGQSSQSQRDASNEELQQMKKVNADLKLKLDNLKKSYEEKLQNQETDFAWKYNTKEDELAQLRNERDRFKDQIKSVESGWQDKYVRVVTELENLEGLSKQENAKLLNTQNDLQSALVKVAQLESDAKNRKDRDNVNLWLATEGFNNGGQPPTNASNELSDSVSKQALEDTNQGYLKKIGELEEQNKDLSDKLRDLESTSSHLTKDYDNLVAEHTKTKDNFASLQGELLSLQNSFSDMKNQHQSLQSLEEQRLKEIQTSQLTLDNLKKAHAQSRQELEAARLIISELKSSSSLNDREISTLKSENSELRINLEKANVIAVENAKSLQAAEQSLIVLDNESNSEPTIDQTKLDKLTEDFEALKQLLNESQDVIKVLTNDKNELSGIVDSLHRQHEQEIETLRVKLSEEQELQLQIPKTQQRVAELEERLENIISENKSLHITIKELQKLQGERDELVKLQMKLIDFKKESTKVMKISNEETHMIAGDSIDELAKFTGLVLQKLKVYTKLDEEMKAIKDDASREVNNLQTKTSELISATLRDLKETQLKLEEQTNKSNELNRDLQSARKRVSILETNLVESKQSLEDKSNQIDKLTAMVKEERKQSQDVAKTKEELVSQLRNAKETEKSQQTKLSELGQELEMTKTKVSQFEEEISKTKEELLLRQYQSSQEESANVAKLKKLLEEQKFNYERKLDDLKKETQILHSELKTEKKQSGQYQQEQQSIINQLDQANTLKIQNEEEIRILMEKNHELTSDVVQLKSSSANSQSENVNLIARIEELNSLLGKQKEEGEQRVGDIQSEVNSLKDIMNKQEIIATEEASKNTQLRRDLNEAQTQLIELKSQIIKLQDEKDLIDSQIEEMSVHKALAEEEAKSAMDRSSDLYNEVTELKKSLKTSRQQLSEVKKSLHKELKNDVGNSSASNVNPSPNVAHMEEVSLRDALHGDTHTPYSEVNFMYLRSVLFKYLTASDPQVAANLIRVVATLLELKPEEEKLLRDTQDSQSSWFNSLIKK
ncbi:unnamed protein product [Allacma fusca]|uniref:GRIP domain-containing protein n=1 Tax=Allacma fusca TaxID=39272 RepID=A0A8J2PBF8_9HEXA|nr:unnamed protein product [Allacma fusca]